MRTLVMRNHMEIQDTYQQLLYYVRTRAGCAARERTEGGAHGAVRAEAAEARPQDGAAHESSHAASHVHHPGAGVVDGAAAEQQGPVLPAPPREEYP